MNKVEIPVRFNDCDMLGHVNNAMYLTYFETGRLGLFKIFNPTLDISKWNLIVASVKCDYIHEINYGQTITVYSWISRLGRSSFDIEHAILDENGRWSARGKVVMVHYNFKEKKA